MPFGFRTAGDTHDEIMTRHWDEVSGGLSLQEEMLVQVNLNLISIKKAVEVLALIAIISVVYHLST